MWVTAADWGLLLLCLCDVFQALINSLGCNWFYSKISRWHFILLIVCLIVIYSMLKNGESLRQFCVINTARGLNLFKLSWLFMSFMMRRNNNYNINTEESNWLPRSTQEALVHRRSEKTSVNTSSRKEKKHTRTHARTHAHERTHARTHAHTHTHTRTHTYIYHKIPTNTHAHTRTRTHTHTHTTSQHTHARTHTHPPTSLRTVCTTSKCLCDCAIVTSPLGQQSYIVLHITLFSNTFHTNWELNHRTCKPGSGLSVDAPLSFSTTIKAMASPRQAARNTPRQKYSHRRLLAGWLVLLIATS